MSVALHQQQRALGLAFRGRAVREELFQDLRLARVERLGDRREVHEARLEAGDGFDEGPGKCREKFLDPERGERDGARQCEDFLRWRVLRIHPRIIT
jgi:hypothetical protein